MERIRASRTNRISFQIDVFFLTVFLLVSGSAFVAKRARVDRDASTKWVLSSSNNKEISNIPVVETRDEKRRQLLQTAALVPSLWFVSTQPSHSAGLFAGRRGTSDLYVLSPKRNTTTVKIPIVDAQLPALNELSSELCLLRLLPVKNPFFRELQATIEGISSLRNGGTPDAFEKATEVILTKGVTELDKKRSRLEPVFDPNEDTLRQISKAERFEVNIEALRSTLVQMAKACGANNRTETFMQQKQALLTLSEIGELLVQKFPYEVPSTGLYSYLPRLLGRCTVTFTFRRRKKILGNTTIIADGFTAPITAGNFVDLSARGFYTGLPIRFAKKRLGTGSEFEVANIPILGSFNDGFYDPLTAKPRRLPLELIRVGKSDGEPDLTYAQGLSSLSGSNATLEPTGNSRPLLSFQIPGLVAMNHPDKNQNGASSEFFSLQADSMMDDKRGLLDGEYAPFGYIVNGYNVFQNLQAGDVIEAVSVSEFGLQTLVKLRRSTFSEVVQGSGESSSESESKPDVSSPRKENTTESKTK